MLAFFAISRPNQPVFFPVMPSVCGSKPLLAMIPTQSSKETTIDEAIHSALRVPEFACKVSSPKPKFTVAVMFLDEGADALLPFRDLLDINLDWRSWALVLVLYLGSGNYLSV